MRRALRWRPPDSFTSPRHGRGRVVEVDGERVLFVAGEAWPFALPLPMRERRRAPHGTIVAPLPGRIVVVAIDEGRQ